MTNSIDATGLLGNLIEETFVKIRFKLQDGMMMKTLLHKIVVYLRTGKFHVLTALHLSRHLIHSG